MNAYCCIYKQTRCMVTKNIVYLGTPLGIQVKQTPKLLKVKFLIFKKF